MIPRDPGDGGRDDREPVCRNTPGNDDDTVVGFMMSETLDRQTCEVVAIACHETSPLSDGPLELNVVRKTARADLVYADRIDATAAQDLGDTRAQVFVEVEPHRARRRWPEAAVNAGWRRCTSSGVQASSQAIRASISSR